MSEALTPRGDNGVQLPYDQPHTGAFGIDEPWYAKALDIGSLPARGAWNALVNTLELPQHALESPAPMLDPDVKRQTTEAAINVGLAGIGVERPPGSLGIFGGVRTATDYGKAALAEAERMRAAGESPAEIWKQTGWHHGVGGDWKYEIPDEDARLKVDHVNLPDGNIAFKPGDLPDPTNPKLGDILYHSALFDKYPNFADTPLYSLPDEARQMNVRAAYYPDTGGIGIGGGPKDELLSSLLHEIQHKVQHTEGFARGGNPEDFLPPGFREDYMKAAQEKSNYDILPRKLGVNLDELHDAMLAGDMGISTPEQVKIMDRARGYFFDNKRMQEFSDVYGNYRNLREQYKDAFKKYNSLAGEVESRTVQERQHYPPEQRIDVPPWKTPGYPTRPQTVMRETHPINWAFGPGTNVRIGSDE